MSLFKHLLAIAFATHCFLGSAQGQTGTSKFYNDQHRPQIHFTPKEHWMNDPNGMVYYNGVYHLFYQHHPGSTVFGPIHWGHATSRDLIHWQHQPIALYPDSLGYIFSGSAVVDYKNTTGFGKNGKVPLVALFTHHNVKGEQEQRNDFQNQSLAYSLDEGKTWTKYKGNPVLKNPGIKDFRDPKVSWNEVANKWFMTLATLDHITFYSSPNLKDWTKESEFGKGTGAHGGVWECPDLFSLNYQGKKIWVLIVNINPGGPNGGSATQYFVGDFDGHQFMPFDNDTRWLDYGPDEYAGVTFSNTGNKKIFLGWMSNWQYAQVVPTQKWRGAMTVPRELSIKKVNGKYLLASTPVAAVNKLFNNSFNFQNTKVTDFDLTAKTGKLAGPAMIKITGDQIKDFSITLSNSLNQKLVIGFDQSRNEFFIDRRESGKVGFEKDFAKRHTAPRFFQSQNFDCTLIIDNASLELFTGDGLTVMTEIFFPDEVYSNISIQSKEELKIKSLAVLLQTQNKKAQSAGRPGKGKEVAVYTTAQNTDYRLAKTGMVPFSGKPQPDLDFSVFVDPAYTFQTMLGIGGALTDASAETFYKLPKDKQKELLTAYFDKNKGIGYTLARTSIQSCDFSPYIYSYVKEGDRELKTFDISHDKKYRIPFIKEVMAATGGKLNLYASPWSPPAFMKDSKDVQKGGKLLPEYRQSWANFFVKFINAYQKEGVPVWGLTVQNEATAASPWESCQFTAEEEKDFVKYYLGPTLQKNGLGNKKLIIWDFNRDFIYQRASAILQDPEAAKFVWGIGFHWYESFSKEGPRYDKVRLAYQAFPGKNLLFTEGCIEHYDANKVNDWALGERYGQAMINDFNAGSSGWTDWNILLDENGGPNHAGNRCFAPVHGNTNTGALTYTNIYYYIGHFSKFIHPGAKRIGCSATNDKLLTTAFRNPDGTTAVIVMNKTDDKIDYLLWIKDSAAKVTSEPHSIQTLIVK